MNRLPELENFLRTAAANGAALAFSGGVDSTLLLAVLARLHREIPFPFAALTMHSVFQGDAELASARETAEKFGVRMEVFSLDPLALPGVRENPPDRCYLCKHHIFGEFRNFANRNSMPVLFDGSHAGDALVYRPGRRALREWNVVSPLAELGIGKEEIRRMASDLGLECASRPASPCLATRFEYGTLLTPEKLRAVAEGERRIRLLLPDADNLRLRVLSDAARIEIPKRCFAEAAEKSGDIVRVLSDLGFRFITLDLEGYRSGVFDPANGGGAEKNSR